MSNHRSGIEGNGRSTAQQGVISGPLRHIEIKNQQQVSYIVKNFKVHDLNAMALLLPCFLGRDVVIDAELSMIHGTIGQYGQHMGRSQVEQLMPATVPEGTGCQSRLTMIVIGKHLETSCEMQQQYTTITLAFD